MRDNIDPRVAGMVRIGTVSDVKNDEHKCRVIFKDSGMTSAWLYVVTNQPFIPDYDAPQVTEYRGGGAGMAAFESHNHDLIIKPWMPKVGQTVLCLYMPVFNADGFVLGGVG